MERKQKRTMQRFYRLQRLQELYRSFWTKARQFDDIEPGCKFAIFSNDNPFIAPMERAYRVLIAVRGGYRYVGQ